MGDFRPAPTIRETLFPAPMATSIVACAAGPALQSEFCRRWPDGEPDRLLPEFERDNLPLMACAMEDLAFPEDVPLGTGEALSDSPLEGIARRLEDLCTPSNGLSERASPVPSDYRTILPLFYS